MKRNEIIAIILMLLATVGTILGVFAIEGARRSLFFTTEIIARTTENGNFYPNRLAVPYGREVRLLIRNIDTVSHGFALPDFGVGVKEIKGGEAVTVKFTPDKKGVFPFHCTVWCSERHLEMGGEIIVR